VYTNRWDLPDSPVDFIATATLTAEGEGTRLMMNMKFADTPPCERR
jgi:hypothetical protein